jgi:type VI secretion system protein ImpL
MLRKIIKIIMFVLASLTLLCLAGYVVFVLKWPLWTLLLVLLTIAVLVVGGLFIRKLLVRRREKRFVEEVIQRDELHLKSLSQKEQNESREMQAKWKEAIDTLKRSHLKKQGNPLYVLPWYMVIGESGSGKTTAIQSARVSSPFAEARKVSGISGTRNCDWWFFENAIVIDTAGRYAIPVDEGRDKGEWHEFLPMLAKYRKKEPLNGLIITVAADKLLTSSPEVLLADAKTIRSRINETMVTLGAKFPVYLLVTKCDLIQGMTQFSEQLPEACLKQAMGCISQDLTQTSDQFSTWVAENIDEHLRKLRMLMLHELKSKSVDPPLLLFPDEFAKLGDPLKIFAEGVFQSNPYQETPLLRGVFFSSGAQEGTAYSHFLRKLGLSDGKTVLPGTDKGLFLHDFFATILPRDRKYFAPTQKAMEWQRVTRNLGLTAWGVLAVVLGMLLGLSFYRNYKIISEVPQQFVQTPVLQGKLVPDMELMSDFRESTAQLESRNIQWPWWSPRFGLDESLKVEQHLKETYSEQFKISFLTPLDHRLSGRIGEFSSATDDEILASYVNHLVRRIILLRTREEGNDLVEKAETTRPPFQVSLPREGQGYGPEVPERITDLYLSYLQWSRNSSQLSLEKSDLMKLLRQAIEARQNDLKWLVAWANQQDDLAPVTLTEFWTSVPVKKEQAQVSPAFTREGKESIERFLDKIQESFPNEDFTFKSGPRHQFEAWYARAYFDEWLAFIKKFPKGATRLAGYQDYQIMSQSVATADGPYFSLLDRLTEELEPFMDREALPSWVKLVFYHQLLKLGYLAEIPMDAEKNLSQRLLGKITQWGQKLSAGLSNTHAMTVNRSRVEKLYLDYRQALNEVVPATLSRSASFQEAANVFRQEPMTGQAPAWQANRLVSELSSHLSAGDADSEAVTDLLRGPLDFLWMFIRKETACHLQSLWEKDVLSEIRGVRKGRAMQNILMGPEGAAKNFIRGPAAPFVSRSRGRGYFPEKALGKKVPLNTTFFSFMTRSEVAERTVQDTYKITLRAVPTSTNSAAQLKPRATYLSMSCDDGLFELANFNFPVQKSVRWSPGTCGDVTLKIEVGDLLLTTRYTGENAFAKFLSDFSGGGKKFTPDSFPQESLVLKRIGIDYIVVRYKFSGHKKAIGLVNSRPGAPPSRISSCWER